MEHGFLNEQPPVYPIASLYEFMQVQKELNKKMHDLEQYQEACKQEKEAMANMAWQKKQAIERIKERMADFCVREGNQQTHEGYAGVSKEQNHFDWDDDAILDALKKSGHTEYIRTKTVESIDKNAIKNDFQVTAGGQVCTPEGEVIEGVTVKKKRTLTIKPPRSKNHD